MNSKTARLEKGISSIHPPFGPSPDKRTFQRPRSPNGHHAVFQILSSLYGSSCPCNHKMPRGRPPLPRTKEEALEARREQVRKNVQAFRQRKQEQNQSDGRKDKKSEGHAFVVQDLGKANGALPKGLEHKRSDVQGADDQLSAGHLPELYSKRSLRSTEHVDDQNFNLSLSIALPREINPAHLSIDQLASTATLAFSPTQTPALVGPHWTQTIPRLTDIHPSLDHSIVALCLLQVSLVHQQPWLLQHSLSSYSRALKSLQASLAQPTTSFRVEIFATSMGLAAYELLQGQVTTGEGGRGWMAHIEGATSYLNLFPDLNIYAFSHETCFHFLETICIFDALGARRPSCFSTSKWWRTSVDRLGDKGYEALLRMITTLPGVLEKVDAVVGMTPCTESVATWRDLLGLSVRLEKALRYWAEESLGQDSFFGAGFRSEGSTTVQGNSTSSNPSTDMEFPNLYVARLYLLYWSSMVLLYESITALLHNLDLATSATASSRVRSAISSPIVYTNTAHTLALNIRYSIHYCLRPENGFIGKSLTLLPLWIARNHLRDCGDLEAKWCDGVLEGMGKRNLAFGLKVRKGL